MKKHIFRSICFSCTIVFISLFVLVMAVLYGYISSTQTKQLKIETILAASGVEANGLSYLSSLEDGDYRITWIDSDGTVLFDNRAQTDEMENHLEREEIKEAIKNGTGASSRYSTTLMERQHYQAVKLSNGSILRLSASHLTWWALIFSMIQPVSLIILAVLILALFLAYRLSEKIVKPLNEMDLDELDSREYYEELFPLIHRIESQQSELKRKQNELNQKKEEFEAATLHMREGIVLLNENGSVISINPAASQILGISEFCVGKELLLFNRTNEIQELLKNASSGIHSEVVCPIVGKNYQMNATPIKNDKKICGIALIIFDITDKEKAESVRREFTANVSHELKTPLQNIAGSAELLSSGMVKPDDVQKFTDRIYQESRRMITLVEDIIKLSHLDEGGTEYQMKDVDLFEIAKQTQIHLQPQIEQKKIQFSLTGASCMIHGIPELLSEITYNLCDNAIKYNYDGGFVNLSILTEEETVVLSVKDTGIGIPENEQDRIFERFYRVDKSHSKEVGGTGLGLSIVKHAALIHQAEIEVKSKLGEGTEIRLIFHK